MVLCPRAHLPEGPVVQGFSCSRIQLSEVSVVNDSVDRMFNCSNGQLTELSAVRGFSYLGAQLPEAEDSVILKVKLSVRSVVRGFGCLKVPGDFNNRQRCKMNIFSYKTVIRI